MQLPATLGMMVLWAIIIRAMRFIHIKRVFLNFTALPSLLLRTGWHLHLHRSW